MLLVLAQYSMWIVNSKINQYYKKSKHNLDYK